MELRPYHITTVLGCFFLVMTFLGSTIPMTAYQATLYTTPGGDIAHNPIAIGELPQECQPVARHLVAGRTVTEEGYRIPTEEYMERHRQQKIDPIFLVKRENISGGWKSGDTFCGNHLFSRTLRVDGQYHDINYQPGQPSFQYDTFLVYIFLTGGAFLCLSLVLYAVYDPALT